MGSERRVEVVDFVVSFGQEEGKGKRLLGGGGCFCVWLRGCVLQSVFRVPRIVGI